MKIFLSMLAVAIVAAGIILLIASEAPALSGKPNLPKAAPGTKPTNSAEISDWITRLTTHINGSCCGEGDAYPVEIDEMPTCKEGLYDKDAGSAHVTNPAPVDIVTQDLDIIHKPVIKGKLGFTFGCSKLTHEKYGNPMSHALAFITTDSDGNIMNVWCVVPLPPGS